MPSLVQLIVELRTSQYSSLTIADASASVGIAGFEVDSNYPPVPVRPTDEKLDATLESSRDHVVLVRGTIKKDQAQELRRQPNVVDVHFDGRTAPFNATLSTKNEIGLSKQCTSRPEEEHSTARAAVPSSTPRGSLPDVARFLGMDQIWADGIRGSGIVIGIVDGGITAEERVSSLYPGLVPRVAGGSPAANWGTTADWSRHGNMAATDALAMAPHAEIYDIRISDESGDFGKVSDAIAGFQWAIERFRRDGRPQILSNSWGFFSDIWDSRIESSKNHPLMRKVIEAIDEGIIVLFSAGNRGQASSSPLGASDTGPVRSIREAYGDSRVITVGAANLDGNSLGDDWQGSAALDGHQPDFWSIGDFAGYFAIDEGSAAACPIAAGVIALLKQARPYLSQATAQRVLRTTAKKNGAADVSSSIGRGIIQGKAAYDEIVGARSAHNHDCPRLKQLQKENKLLRDLFVDSVLASKVMGVT